MRRDLCHFVDYIGAQPTLLSNLIRGYCDSEIALNSGTMLREVRKKTCLKFN